MYRIKTEKTDETTEQPPTRRTRATIIEMITLSSDDEAAAAAPEQPPRPPTGSPGDMLLHFLAQCRQQVQQGEDAQPGSPATIYPLDDETVASADAVLDDDPYGPHDIHSTSTVPADHSDDEATTDGGPETPHRPPRTPGRDWGLQDPQDPQPSTSGTDPRHPRHQTWSCPPGTPEGGPRTPAPRRPNSAPSHLEGQPPRRPIKNPETHRTAQKRYNTTIT